MLAANPDTRRAALGRLLALEVSDEVRRMAFEFFELEVDPRQPPAVRDLAGEALRLLAMTEVHQRIAEYTPKGARTLVEDLSIVYGFHTVAVLAPLTRIITRSATDKPLSSRDRAFIRQLIEPPKRAPAPPQQSGLGRVIPFPRKDSP